MMGKRMAVSESRDPVENSQVEVEVEVGDRPSWQAGERGQQ